MFFILQTIEFDFYFTSDLFGLMLDKQSEYIRAIKEDASLVQLIDSVGYTIFHQAAAHGRLQVMEAINDIDAHMKDRLNKYNHTALMMASQNDQAACVKWLLDHDTDVNIKDGDGRTALFYARWNQEIEDMIKKK